MSWSRAFSRVRFTTMRSVVVLASLIALCAVKSVAAQKRNDVRSSKTSQTKASQNKTSHGKASHNMRASSDDELTTRLDTTVAVERGTIVDLSASDGRITVRGWDRNEVEVHAVSESGELQFSKSARSIRVEARRSGRSRTLDATITVRVPLNTRVVVGTMLGDVEVLDVRGEVDATLYSGNVTIRGASGRTAVSNVAGDIVISDIDGALRVNAMTGEMKLSDVRGDVDVTSNSGDVSMRGMLSNSVQVQVVEGEITYDGALSKSGKYSFNTHSGDVHLFLPDSTKGTVILQSFSGSLHSTFPIMVQPRAGAPGSISSSVRQLNGRAMSLNQQQRLEIGGGNGAQVTISTFNGDVHINRGPRRQEKDF